MVVDVTMAINRTRRSKDARGNANLKKLSDAGRAKPLNLCRLHDIF